ncbi:hypothetical protein PHMEG_00038180, partial [Phytophthora megakarya]
RDRVRSVTSGRDSARAESERRRVLCDTTAAELDDARGSLDRGRRELDVARAANQPLQDDLRRVNALSVAHAEEHQREVARIRDSETSSSDSAQASVLPLASRAALFRSALVDARRSATQRREQTQERVRRLTARAAGLENALALSQQASQAEIARLGDLIDQTCSGHALWAPRVYRLSFVYSVDCGPQLFCSFYRGRVDIYGGASIPFSAE